MNVYLVIHMVSEVLQKGKYKPIATVGQERISSGVIYQAIQTQHLVQALSSPEQEHITGVKMLVYARVKVRTNA